MKRRVGEMPIDSIGPIDSIDRYSNLHLGEVGEMPIDPSTGTGMHQ